MGKIKQFTNHVALVVDASYSMNHLSAAVIKNFDALVKSLKSRSEEHNQETRVSVYVFKGGGRSALDIPVDISVAAFDMDVMRMPSIRDFYNPQGGTPLLRAANQALGDLKTLPELYTDHAFLVYIFTDGEENTSGELDPGVFKNYLRTLPENWTVVAHVPDIIGKRRMELLGLAAGNIEVWDATTERGLTSATQSFDSSVDRYMTQRSKGIRGSSTYFQMDASNLTAANVKAELTPISSRKFKLIVNPELTAQPIKQLVEDSTGKPYVLGNSYFALVKNETIQPQKKILVKSKTDGKVYGGDEARELVGLNVNHSVLVRPTLSPNFDVFVQSTSVNRNIIPKQEVIVLS